MGRRGFTIIRFLALALLGLWVCATQALAADGKWLRGESKHFIAYGEVSDRELREAVQNLEMFDSVLRWVLSVGDKGEAGAKLEFYLVKTAGAVRIAAPHMDKNVAGFYTASIDMIAAVGVARDGAGYDGQGQEILFHEYAHHFMFQHFPGGYPIWYVEGLAEYLSSVKLEKKGKISFGQAPGSARTRLGLDSWLDFEKLFTAKLSDLPVADRSRFYGVAWGAMHYFMSDQARQKQLAAYINLLRDGVAAQAAFEKAFSLTYVQAGAEVKKYLSKSGEYYLLDASFFKPATEVVVTPVPASADTLMLPLLRVRLHGYTPPDRLPQERAALYAEMAAKAPAAASDAFAERYRAYVEVYLGDPARAKPLLEAALAGDPNDADALYLMGMMYFAQAEARGEAEANNLKEGRAYMVRLFKITDRHVPMLYNYAMSYGRRGPLTENQLNVLVRAQQLAPQVVTIGMNTAVALGRANRYDEAAMILRPISGNPHGGEAAAAARKMLDDMAARRPN